MERESNKDTCYIKSTYKKLTEAFPCFWWIFFVLTLALVAIFSDRLNEWAIQYHHLLDGFSKLTPIAIGIIAFFQYRLATQQKEFNQTRVSDYKKKIIFENYYSLKNRSVSISEYFFITPVNYSRDILYPRVSYAGLLRDLVDPNHETFRTLIMDSRKISDEWSKDIAAMDLLGLDDIVQFHNSLFAIFQELNEIYFKTVDSDETVEISYIKIREYKAEFEREFSKSKEIYQKYLNK